MQLNMFLKNYNFNPEIKDIVDELKQPDDEQPAFTAEARRTRRLRRGVLCVLRFIAVNVFGCYPINPTNPPKSWFRQYSPQRKRERSGFAEEFFVSLQLMYLAVIPLIQQIPPNPGSDKNKQK